MKVFFFFKIMKIVFESAYCLFSSILQHQMTERTDSATANTRVLIHASCKAAWLHEVRTTEAKQGHSASPVHSQDLNFDSKATVLQRVVCIILCSIMQHSSIYLGEQKSYSTMSTLHKNVYLCVYEKNDK